MGLDFSHGNAHWAYSGFNRFRVKLARQIGWESLAHAYETPLRPDGSSEVYTDKGFEDHPLKELLTHSDCDGELSPEECGQIAPALRNAVLDWPAHDFDKETALQLALGMERAAEEGEPLEFR